MRLALFGVSAPVFGGHRGLVAIVSVWGPEHRVPASRLRQLGESAKLAASDVEKLLG